METKHPIDSSGIPKFRLKCLSRTSVPLPALSRNLSTLFIRPNSHCSSIKLQKLLSKIKTPQDIRLIFFNFPNLLCKSNHNFRNFITIFLTTQRNLTAYRMLIKITAFSSTVTAGVSLRNLYFATTFNKVYRKTDPKFRYL